MRGEREHRVIDEKLVGLGRPTQRLQERRADMTDDRVVMADAELAGELTDARCAGLLGDAVERRARKIEEDGVERLVDHEARIALQVVQICCAGADIRLDDALAVFPELAVRVIVKFQADEIGILGGKRPERPGTGLSSRVSVTASSTLRSERVISEGGASFRCKNLPASDRKRPLVPYG